MYDCTFTSSSRFTLKLFYSLLQWIVCDHIIWQFDKSTINVEYLFYHLEYTCHGSWRENQTSFIIARHAGTKHGVCISFKQSTTETAQLYIGDSCYRDHQGLDTSSERQYTIANLTNVGRKLNTLSFHYCFYKCAN